MSSPGRAPVIVIGMHRSGTAAVTRALESAGFFVGARKDKNHEAQFFKDLNNWLLRQSGAAWDRPEPVRALVENLDVRALCAEYLREVVRSPRVGNFLGWGRYLRFRGVDRLDFPWGWKDPRNTFTLPIWLDLFPEARIVHVVRHGVDVAASLRARQRRDLARRRDKFRRNRPLYLIWSKRTGFTDTLRCATLEGGLELWEEYVAAGRAHVAALGARATEIRYEDLTADPDRVLGELSVFCQLSPPDSALERAAVTVRRDRREAFRQEGELEAFARRKADRLRIHGY